MKSLYKYGILFKSNEYDLVIFRIAQTRKFFFNKNERYIQIDFIEGDISSIIPIRKETLFIAKMPLYVGEFQLYSPTLVNDTTFYSDRNLTQVFFSKGYNDEYLIENRIIETDTEYFIFLQDSITHDEYKELFLTSTLYQESIQLDLQNFINVKYGRKHIINNKQPFVEYKPIAIDIATVLKYIIRDLNKIDPELIVLNGLDSNSDKGLQEGARKLLFKTTPKLSNEITCKYSKDELFDGIYQTSQEIEIELRLEDFLQAWRYLHNYKKGVDIFSLHSGIFYEHGYKLTYGVLWNMPEEISDSSELTQSERQVNNIKMSMIVTYLHIESLPSQGKIYSWLLSVYDNTKEGKL